MVHFVKKYGELPYNQFSVENAKDLFLTSFPLGEVITYAPGSAAVNEGNYSQFWIVPSFTQLCHHFIDNGKKSTIVLIGKGVCYDSGGYNLKHSHLEDMKFDKLGAINIMAITKELQKQVKPKHNYLVICPFVANLMGPGATVPGDIITYHVNTKDVRCEITDTDAEGRLILADAILLAQQERNDIVLMLDMATLTGHAGYALGQQTIAYYANRPEIIMSIQGVFDKYGLEASYLPIFPSHRKKLHPKNTRIADIQNYPCGNGGTAGMQIASAFLEYFNYKNVPWLHLDIASIAYKNGKAFTGLVKPVVEFVTNFRGGK